MKVIRMEHLVGKHILSGVKRGWMKTTPPLCGPECIDFILDGKHYRAVQDSCDGYRSVLGDLYEYDDFDDLGGYPAETFPPSFVICTKREGPYTYILDCTDIETAKVVLSIGTDYTDDYYPCCVMEYYPENLECNMNKEGI